MFITVEFFLLQAVVDFDIHFGHYSNYTSKGVLNFVRGGTNVVDDS